MADTFFTQEYCDRCGGSLEQGRTMSMYNTECICMNCKSEEMQRADYAQAQMTEHQEVINGNYNYEGVGM